MYHREVRNAYREALQLFFDGYVRKSGDHEIFGVAAPFFAFRCAVIANPLFYPDLGASARRALFDFTRNVLAVESFDPGRVNEYCRSA